MRINFLNLRLNGAAALFICMIFSPVYAILDEDNQKRWEKPIEGEDLGLEAGVPGFLVNMGPTGMRTILKKKSFIVKHIFKGSPASGKIKVNDEILAANGKEFSAHTFGGDSKELSPIRDFGLAIEDSEGRDGKLSLKIKRGGAVKNIVLQLEKLGKFTKNYPDNCKKSHTLWQRALKHLYEVKRDAGVQARCTRILALLASGNKKYQSKAKELALAWRDSPNSETWTWNLSFQIITLSEYYIQTGDRSVLKPIEVAVGYLQKAQYQGRDIAVWTDAQIKETKTDIPFSPATLKKHQALYKGGFGHAPYNFPGAGNNGYGPMQTTTMLAVTAFQLAKQCGVKVKQKHIDDAFTFIEYCTNKAGSIGYGGEFTLAFGLRDPVKYKNGRRHGNSNRSGLAIITNKLSSENSKSHDNIKLHIKNISKSHIDMADGHADPILLLTWGLIGTGASGDLDLRSQVFDYYKPWLNMARCFDSTYIALPGRNYADGSYYNDANHIHVTAMAALIYGLSLPKLQVQGVTLSIAGINHKSLQGPLKQCYTLLKNNKVGQAYQALSKMKLKDEKNKDISEKMLSYISKKIENKKTDLEKLYNSSHWNEFQTDLSKAQLAYGKVESFATQSQAWIAELKTPFGKEMIKASKGRVDEKYGTVMKQLISMKDKYTKPEQQKHVKQIEDDILSLIEKELNHYDEIAELGKWNTLKKRISKDKKNRSGVPSYDEKVKEWEKQFKSEEGKLLVKNESYMDTGKYGKAYANLKSAVSKGKVSEDHQVIQSQLEDLENRAEMFVERMNNLKEGKDWYAFSKDLSKGKSSYAGLSGFDENVSAWSKDIKSSGARRAITAGKMFEKLQFYAQKKPTASLKKKLQSFIKKYSDTAYAEKAKELLGS